MTKSYNPNMNKFYITTAIPYVNAKPHIGHALEFIQADVISRYHKLLGDDILFLSGSDENALKNVTAAEEAELDTQVFVDRHANFFKKLAAELNINFDVFQKGSAQNHYLASQKLWELCESKGDIYKKNYRGLYCIGCEAFYVKEELNENYECFEHPGKKLEEVEEENYFFKLSKYQNQLIKIISSGDQKWWPADAHVIGKGITRFHAVYWPAFLLSAKLKLPKELFVHEYITVNGQKMSKTLGNVLDPIPLIEKYGADALRYYCLAKISPFTDSDFSEDKFKETYNADLANGLGNLVARVAKLCENNKISTVSKDLTLTKEVVDLVKNYKFNETLTFIWSQISKEDKKINETRPWELSPEKVKPILEDLVARIQQIAFNLQPFLPKTAEKILTQFSGEIKSSPPLFPRI